MRILLMAAITVCSIASYADSYKVDPAHTELGFSVKHLLISNVKGRFDGFSGTFDYDKSTLKITNLSIEIDPSTINTNNANRDKHLKSDDFFDTTKYKTITFTSTSSDVSKDGKTAVINGNLKIKNKSLPVKLDLIINGEAEIEGTKKIAFTATTEINRKKWDVSWNQNLDAGGVAVSDEVKIIIEGEANLVKPKSTTK